MKKTIIATLLVLTLLSFFVGSKKQEKTTTYGYRPLYIEMADDETIIEREGLYDELIDDLKYLTGLNHITFTYRFSSLEVVDNDIEIEIDGSTDGYQIAENWLNDELKDNIIFTIDQTTHQLWDTTHQAKLINIDETNNTLVFLEEFMSGKGFKAMRIFYFERDKVVNKSENNQSNVDLEDILLGKTYKLSTILDRNWDIEKIKLFELSD